MKDTYLPDATRRTILQAAVGALGVGAVGTAAGHPADGEHDIHEHHDTENTELVGYHSLGGLGTESESGKPEDAMHGVVSEVWVEGDYAFVSFLSSSGEDGNRGVAVIDVSEYTTADTVDETGDAEMEVVSFIGNEAEAGTAADVKVNGDILAYSKQAIGTLYGEPVSTSTAVHDAPGVEPLGVLVYDVSDPKNPQYLGTGQGPNVGFHNCFVHEIDETYYVFGVQGAVPGDAGIHVFRVNESGGVVPVNFWSGGDLAQGEYDSKATEYYCHDFYVHDDPETKTPLGFVSYWDYGLQVLDLSDPTDIEELGRGKLPRTHYAQPVPAPLGEDGKRVFMAGQEHGSQVQDISGYVRIFDGDDIFDDGVTELTELDSWTLYENVNYDGYSFSPHNADVTADGWITQAHYHAGIHFLKIQSPSESPTGEWRLAGQRFEPRDEGSDPKELDQGESFAGTMPPGVRGFVISTREFTPEGNDVDAIDASLTWSPEQQDLDFYLEKNVSGDPDDPQWLTVAAAETRDGFESFRSPVETGTRYRFVVSAYENVLSEWEISATYLQVPGPEPERKETEKAQAYYRDHVEVPPASQTEGPMAPNFWSARHENGVTFGGDINTGFYAIVADPVPVGTREEDDRKRGPPTE
jgi:hypothetical protein